MLLCGCLTLNTHGIAVSYGQHPFNFRAVGPEMLLACKEDVFSPGVIESTL